MRWIELREAIIKSTWNAWDLLSYPIPPRKRELLEEQRSQAKLKRFARDAAKASKAAIRAQQIKDLDFNYVPPKVEIPKPYVFQCPNCQSDCRVKTEAKNDASGCFILLFGLALCGSPFLLAFILPKIVVTLAPIGLIFWSSGNDLRFHPWLQACSLLGL